MRKKCLYLLLMTLIGCHTPDKELNNEQNSSADSISINFTQQNDASKITKQADTAIHLIIAKDTAYYKKGEDILVKSYIRPKTIINGDNNNPKEIQDDAFIIANCLIIMRNIKSAGHFCYIPEVDKVEIYTQNGTTSVIKRGDTKSKSLMGFDFTSNFLGNKFTSSTGTWGLINIESEGNILGYMIIYSDGTVKEEYIEDKVSLAGITYSAEFNEVDELVWTNLTENEVPVKFIVNSNGDYRIEKK